MATLEDLAKGYAQKLYKDPSEKTALDIVSQINNLTYEKDKQLISIKTKTELVDSIKNILKVLTKTRARTGKFKHSNLFMLEKSRNFMSTASTDTSEFNDLVSLIIKGTTK